MMRLYKTISSLCIVLCLFGGIGCVDVIPLEVPENNPRKLVIQARVVNGNPAAVEVSITKSADFVTYFNADKVSDASVRIIDETGRSIQVEEERPGEYRELWTNNADFQIERGKSYQLEIQTPDGKIYMSDFERIYAVPTDLMVNINLDTRNVLNEQENIVETTFIQYLMETTLKHPEEEAKAYLKWDMKGVFRLIELAAPIPIPGPKTCFIHENVGLDEVRIFNGFETNETVLKNYMIYEEPMNWNYSAGYYLTVYQQSLSKGAYEYWNQVKEVSSREGSLFEKPPGKILSNIRNINDENEQVLGYFYTTEIDTVRRFITAEDANYPGQPCTPFEYTDDETPGYCRNCLEWPNSTTIKPSYWVE